MEWYNTAFVQYMYTELSLRGFSRTIMNEINSSSLTSYKI